MESVKGECPLPNRGKELVVVEPMVADVTLKAIVSAGLVESSAAVTGGMAPASGSDKAAVGPFTNERWNTNNCKEHRDAEIRRMSHRRRDSLPSESEIPKHSAQSYREKLVQSYQQRDGFEVVPSRHQRHHDDAISQLGYEKSHDFDWSIFDADYPKGNVYSSEAAYSFRFVMLSRYVGKFIGRHGAHIKNIVHKTGVISISVEQDWIIEKTNQVVNVYGDRDTCDSACYEILKFLFFMNTGRQADECPDSSVQLMLLANDDYCGMLIGRDGRTLRQMRQESDTRISFAKLLGDSRFMELYPERVVFVSGYLRNVVVAQSEITSKQYEMRLHETDCWQGYGTRRPNIHRTMQELDNNTICDIIIENDVAGAVIGRRGANIKTIMTKSQALVSVLPKIRELESTESKRYARIAGSHEAVFRASYMVFLYVTRALSDKPKMDSLELDSLLFVPALSVGHIIGKRGHRVRNIEARTDVKIYILNAPQPPPSPSGSCRSRVKITGNFWNTQAAIREVLKIVNNVTRRNVAVDHEVFPVRQRRASLSTARELTFYQANHFADEHALSSARTASGDTANQQARSSRTNGDAKLLEKDSTSRVPKRSEDAVQETFTAAVGDAKLLEKDSASRVPKRSEDAVQETATAAVGDAKLLEKDSASRVPKRSEDAVQEAAATAVGVEPCSTREPRDVEVVLVKSDEEKIADKGTRGGRIAYGMFPTDSVTTSVPSLIDETQVKVNSDTSNGIYVTSDVAGEKDSIESELPETPPEGELLIPLSSPEMYTTRPTMKLENFSIDKNSPSSFNNKRNIIYAIPTIVISEDNNSIDLENNNNNNIICSEQLIMEMVFIDESAELKRKEKDLNSVEPIVADSSDGVEQPVTDSVEQFKEDTQKVSSDSKDGVQQHVMDSAEQFKEDTQKVSSDSKDGVQQAVIDSAEQFKEDTQKVSSDSKDGVQQAVIDSAEQFKEDTQKVSSDYKDGVQQPVMDSAEQITEDIQKVSSDSKDGVQQPVMDSTEQFKEDKSFSLENSTICSEQPSTEMVVIRGAAELKPTDLYNVEIADFKDGTQPNAIDSRCDVSEKSDESPLQLL